MCESFFDLLYKYQILISGILAIIAAAITARVIWRAANLPVQYKREEDAKLITRQKYYISTLLLRNLHQILRRANTIKEKLSSRTSSNQQIKEHKENVVKLYFDNAVDDWALVSLLPSNLLLKISVVRNLVDEHNYDIEREMQSLNVEREIRAEVLDRLDKINNACNNLIEELMRIIKEMNY